MHLIYDENLKDKQSDKTKNYEINDAIIYISLMWSNIPI